MKTRLIRRLRNGLLGGFALGVLTAGVCVGLGAREGDAPAIAVLAAMSGFVGFVMGALGATVD